MKKIKKIIKFWKDYFRIVKLLNASTLFVKEAEFHFKNKDYKESDISIDISKVILKYIKEIDKPV